MTEQARERASLDREQAHSQATLSLRSLRLRYLLALGLIAALAVGGQVFLQQLLETHESDASLLNFAGRQRMLAMGINRSLLMLSCDPHPAHRQAAVNSLSRNLEEWERMHAKLTQGHPNLSDQHHLSPRSRELAGQLEVPGRLMAQTARRALSAGEQASPWLDDLADEVFVLVETYLPVMDALVASYVEDSRRLVDKLRYLEIVLTGALLLVLVLVALFIFRPVARRIRSDMFRLTALAEEMRDLSLRDGLTGIFNRRHFDEQLMREWRRAMREDQVLSLLFMDIDHFKAFNDQYGHQAGDRALKSVASAAEGALRRPGDLLARYGGEEFAVVLPQTGLEGALLLAENIRAAVEALAIPNRGASSGPLLTVSLGVAVSRPARNQGPKTLVEAADQALYRAKQAGRNRVAGPPGQATEDWS